jgi:hypothetical protein
LNQYNYQLTDQPDKFSSPENIPLLEATEAENEKSGFKNVILTKQNELTSIHNKEK